MFCRSRRPSLSGRSTRPRTPSRKSDGSRSGNLKVVSDVEARVRHDDAADERRNRRLAVERMRPMDDEARRRSPAGTRPPDRSPAPVARRQRRAAAAAGHDAGAGRRRIDVDAARHLKRLHELRGAALVARFDDQIERVLPLDDGFALDLDAVLPDVGAAEVVQQHRPDVRILRGAALGRVLMTDDEERHGSPNYCVPGSLAANRNSSALCSAIRRLGRRAKRTGSRGPFLSRIGVRTCGQRSRSA